MKSAGQVAQMHMLLQVGWSKRMVASRLGISRNTLERYLDSGDGRSASVGHRTSKLELCLEWLAEEGEGRGGDSETLRRRLAEERAIQVSRRTMQRALKCLRDRKNQNEVKSILPNVARHEDGRLAEPGWEAAGWRIGPYKLSSSGELSLSGSRIQMAAAQGRLLLLFVNNPNRLIGQAEIASQLWPAERFGQSEARKIRLSVHRLRQVFASGPLGGDVLRSIYRKGYAFHAPVEEMPATRPNPAELIRTEHRVNRLPSQTVVDPFIIVNPFYSEVHDYWPSRDPYRLQRQEYLLRKSVHHDPLFEQGYLELSYIQLLQCFWGMRSAAEVRSTLQQQQDTIQHLRLQPAGWLAIKAEVQSLLLWQPLTTQRLYGRWLAETLPRGMPLQAWTRHLIFSGQPKTAVKLLKAQVSEDLCHGWLSLAMAYCAIGHFAAAEEAIEKQLRIEPSMVGPRLFLALLLAKRGQSKLSTRLVFETGLLDRPFQGVQALAAYALAQGGHFQRAHQLLDRALENISLHPAQAGAIGYWGLAALELERQAEATQLLKLSIQHRCYSAPVLFSTPFIKAYASTPAYRLFTERMRKSFPI